MEGNMGFSKLAIASFILSLYSIVIIGLGFIIDLYIIHPEFPVATLLGIFFAFFTNLVALILSIISLRVIKRTNLKGKTLAWISLVISVLLLLPTFSWGMKVIFHP